MYSVVVVQEVLQSWSASWRWGAEWLVIESLQQSVESQHWSWSSSNYMRSCRRTQHWPFYSCSAFEESEGEKAQYVGLGSWPQIKRIKKPSFGSVVFSFSVQQWTISQFDCDMWWNMDFMPNQWGPAQWIKWEEAPKHSPKPHLHQQNVMITFSGLLLVWSTKVFWIDWNNYIWEAYSTNGWDAPQTASTAAGIGQQNGPNSPWLHRATCYITNASKDEWIVPQSFASFAIFIWLLANWLLLLQVPQKLFAGKTFPQPAGGRKCFPRVHLILKHGFLCYRNKQAYFSMAKMHWV